MKHVLIALDYDPTAQKVAEQGYALAKAMDADVTLLHVIVDPVYYSSVNYSNIMGFEGYSPNDFLQNDVSKTLIRSSQKFLDNTKKHLKDDHIKTKIVEGDSAEVILATAKDLKAKFIIMGSHSRRWLEEIIMGDTTHKVLKDSKIPVLVIPTKQEK